MRHEDHSVGVSILRALADDIRLGIVKDIANKKEAVPSCTVVGACSKRAKLSQPAMSHHFKKLVDANILLLEKQKTENYYRFNKKLLQDYGIDVDKL